MNSKKIRNIFFDYFKSKNHKIIQSAPITVKDDPTLMFTNAGMNQFKNIFLGNESASTLRIANTQKCLRVSGKHIYLDHGNGYRTVYAHLDKFNVRKNQKVKRGELIAYSGNSGRSTAPHLHYEVHKNGKKINPINFFFNDLTPNQYEEVIKLASVENQALGSTF